MYLTTVFLYKLPVIILKYLEHRDSGTNLKVPNTTEHNALPNIANGTRIMFNFRRLGIVTIQLPCKMCNCQHKIHWSVVAIIVNVVCLVLSTTGMATDHWAVKTEDGYTIHAGLFRACKKLNDTCYDTHTYFDEHQYGTNTNVCL